MTNEPGIGIVGSGLMARTYAETLAKYVRGCRFVALAVGSRAPRLAADYGVACEPSLDALVARADIDGLIVTTPEMPRIEQVRSAAAAGKHLLLEKPMAASVAECDTLIDICQRAGVMLMQVQSQRFRAIHQRMHQLLSEGAIGQVRQMRIVSMLEEQWSKAAVADRPFYRDPQGGGLMMSQLVHNLDMLRWVVGAEATRVFACGGSFGSHGIPDMSIQAQISFAGGASGQLWVCMETPGVVFPQNTFRTQVIGERGLLDFDGYTHLDVGTPDGKWQRVMEQEPFNTLDPKDPVRLRSFSAQNQEFVDAIREKRQPAVTAADGRAAVELAQAVLQSVHSGVAVDLPL
ncbi:MAG: Gfo/Idh/MocA family oxidoreductase [Chloroflexi bacterium]|nr:Gfo/Idh/MocA family oxidoreductase [Chloroflexota bacterium]